MMLSERGDYATRNTTSTSMVINMRKWLEVMDSYVSGGFAYYTTSTYWAFPKSQHCLPVQD
jgi:alanine-glyoxylate transaminase/serine-glyoxylate transaminase/serine-pyruvate transaminase